eukprot:TRINITY_DN6246_c2_g1_i2.p2 TRINITY_DN6246_c2_g1~~TRINITY_DN6246_c2_g1_i2.p2  ORF type:complete len:209 (+),score=64.98 TRINITY_DN6246_c2_g1_i2:1545-2171(+)
MDASVLRALGISAGLLVAAKCLADRRSMPVTIAVGTRNPGKLAAVKEGLERVMRRPVIVVSASVPSGVSNQPQTLEETMKGAENRARAALKAHPGAAAGVGLESGLVRTRGVVMDLCGCCITDGAATRSGVSSAWQQPDSVAARLADGSTDLNVAWEHLVADADPDGGGLLAILSGGSLGRPEQMRQSVESAAVACVREYYGESPLDL